MSRGYRLYQLAAGGFLAVVLACPALSQSEQPTAVNTETAAEAPRRQQGEPGPSIFIAWPNRPEPVKAAEYRPDCSRPKDHEESDLCEQRRMAEAAEDQSGWVQASFWLSILTLGGLFWTLYYSKRNAEAAVTAAQAAQASVQTTRDTARVELRAYLAVNPAGIDQLIGQTNGVGLVEIRNVGELPARSVCVEVRMKNGQYRDTEFPLIADDPTTDRVIQPGAEMRQGSRQDAEPAGFTEDAGRYVYVWGAAWYDDGYGERRFTRFCHRYTTQARNMDVNLTVPTQRTATIIDRDKARYHEYGNGAT